MNGLRRPQREGESAPAATTEVRRAGAAESSADDLSNYFYNLRGPPGWAQRNAVGRVFTGAEAEALGGDPTRRYHMCLTVVVMGDLNVVDIAQSTHEGVLREGGCLQEGTLLQYHAPFPRGRLLEGAYVDDHLLVAILERHLMTSKDGEDLRLLRQAREAYERAHLCRAEEKSFEGSPDFVAWGTHGEV